MLKVLQALADCLGRTDDPRIILEDDSKSGSRPTIPTTADPSLGIETEGGTG
jgi:hypothetical protein